MGAEMHKFLDCLGLKTRRNLGTGLRRRGKRFTRSLVRLVWVFMALSLKVKCGERFCARRRVGPVRRIRFPWCKRGARSIGPGGLVGKCLNARENIYRAADVQDQRICEGRVGRGKIAARRLEVPVTKRFCSEGPGSGRAPDPGILHASRSQHTESVPTCWDDP